MRRRSVLRMICSAAALVVAAAVLHIHTAAPARVLVLQDTESGAQYAAYPVETGDVFSVEFIHSVNQSPVRDFYEVREGGELFVVETHYYAFGAGVQTELAPGETLAWGEDGAMQVRGIDKQIPKLVYRVGTVSDHVLCIGGETVSLRDLCGRNASVHFYVR